MDDLQQQTSPQKPKLTKLSYTGQFQDMAKLGAINAALTAVTLGGYFARANTDVCKALANHTRLGKPIPVTYTGTPMEFARQVFPAAIGVIISALILQWSVSSMNYLIFFLMLIACYGLSYYGFFAAFKTRVQALKIGSTAVTLRLSPIPYMMLFMKRALFNLISFGYKIPNSDLEKWALLVSNIQVGSTKLSFTGSTKPLFWTHLVSLGLPLILGITLVLMLGPVLSGDPAIDQQRIAASQQILTFLLYMTLIAGIFGRSWYQAALRTECLRGLTCGKLRFRSTATGHDLFKLRIVNTMILLVTLGLGWGITKHRTMEFFARTLVIQGDVEAVTNPAGETL